MDGFHTFASSKGGGRFSVVEVALVRSVSSAASLQARKIAFAIRRAVALHLGGVFIPKGWALGLCAVKPALYWRVASARTGEHGF